MRKHLLKIGGFTVFGILVWTAYQQVAITPGLPPLTRHGAPDTTTDAPLVPEPQRSIVDSPVSTSRSGIAPMNPIVKAPPPDSISPPPAPPKVRIDSDDKRNAFLNIILQSDICNIEQRFQGQTKQSLMADVPATLPAHLKSEAEAQASLMDDLWLTYEYECVTAAMDYVARGGEMHTTGKRKRDGRGISASYWVGPEQGFAERGLLDVDYVLRFEDYPRVREILKAYYEEKAKFDGLVKR